MMKIDEELKPLLKGETYGDWKLELGQAVRSLLVDYGQLKLQLESERLEFKDTKRKMLLRILEAMDAFERVLDGANRKVRIEDLKIGINLTSFNSVLGMLQDIMYDEGVRLINFPDNRATINECKIVRAEKKEGYADLTILEVIEKGYYCRDEILRKASVIVVKK